MLRKKVLLGVLVKSRKVSNLLMRSENKKMFGGLIMYLVINQAYEC